LLLLLPPFSDVATFFCCRWARHRQQEQQQHRQQAQQQHQQQQQHYDGDSKMSAHDYALHILDDDEVAGRSAWSLDLQIFLGKERGAPRDPEFPRLRGVARPVLSSWSRRHIPRHLINECEGQFRLGRLNLTQLH